MLSSYIQQFKSEYDKSPWLRYVAPVLVFLLTLYLVDALSVSSNQASQEYRQLLVRESKIQALQDQADWEVAKTSAEEKYHQLSHFIWQAETLELASADLQTELRTLTKGRIVALRINIGPSVQTDVPDIWKLSAEVSGKFLASSVADMLIDMAQKDKAISLERFSYMPARGQNGVMHISILVSLASDKESNE